MYIGSKEFESGHTYIMGILNVTPDSFSDGGKYDDADKALKHIEEMIKDGADVIDIGGESTRPGYERISEAEEIERIAPVIEKAKEHFDIPLSIDTYKPEVAEEALRLGAHLINDIWGLKGENLKFVKYNGQISLEMASVIAKYNASCCIMHNRLMSEETFNRRTAESNTGRILATGSSCEKGIPDRDIVNEVTYDLGQSLKAAYDAGIDKDRIVLDPGVGFGKTYVENLGVLKYLRDICKAFDVPMLLGTSKKSVIGLTLGLGKDERSEGTLATTARAVECGCMFVRVHEVKENARFIKMYEAILAD